MQQTPLKEQGSQALLEMYLQALDLEAFRDNYQAYSKDATRSGLPYERFLLALCEAEICRLSQYFSRLTHNFSLAFEQKTTPLKTGSAT